MASWTGRVTGSSATWTIWTVLLLQPAAVPSLRLLLELLLVGLQACLALAHPLWGIVCHALCA